MNLTRSHLRQIILEEITSKDVTMQSAIKDLKIIRNSLKSFCSFSGEVLQDADFSLDLDIPEALVPVVNVLMYPNKIEDIKEKFEQAVNDLIPFIDDLKDAHDRACDFINKLSDDYLAKAESIYLFDAQTEADKKAKKIVVAWVKSVVLPAFLTVDISSFNKSVQNLKSLDVDDFGGDWTSDQTSTSKAKKGLSFLLIYVEIALAIYQALDEYELRQRNFIKPLKGSNVAVDSVPINFVNSLVGSPTLALGKDIQDIQSIKQTIKELRKILKF